MNENRTGQALARKYLAPRSHVPADLRSALVGNLDEQDATAIARLIARKMMEKARPRRIVFVDLDRCVYAARPDTASADLLSITHPELLVGLYDRKAEIVDIAADLEAHRRERGL